MNAEENKKPKKKRGGKPNMFSLLKSYKGMILLLVILTLLSNGINLIIPKIISNSIDSFTGGHLIFGHTIFIFGLAALFIFLFTYLQSVVQTYASERVARDLRTKLSDKISRQSYVYIEKANPSKLLTNLTSDVDAIKTFVSQAIASMVSSLFIIIGVSVLLISINWKLALAVLTIIPIITITFILVLRKVKVLFTKSREVIDWLNKVINESILGSSLIRVLNSQMPEYEKFMEANAKAKELGLSILTLFAALIPVINFVANMAMLTVLALGGHFVITGSMTLGEFAAFNSYIALLIFPIIIIGFMSNIIAQASASYKRIETVLNTPDTPETGNVKDQLQGNITVKDLTLTYADKPALKDVSFAVKGGSKTAIIGPTAAGKSQLLYLLTGLIKPTHGSIEFDGKDIEAFEKETFHKQIGFVFQDSIIFNMSVRENIAFSNTVTDEALNKAINSAELREYVEGLPQKIDTIVSERGTSLSGGQKQRIMLARALAVNPKVLLLDDFTARVDTKTEQKILENIQQNYPDITLISVTQKIAAVEHYDQIILLMQGEIVATGTHKELMRSSPEYIQIYNSQRSTSNYELQS